MASSSAAISLRRLTPANRYSTRKEPEVGGNANEDARGEDANEPAAVSSELLSRGEAGPTITEEVHGGEGDGKDNEAKGKAELDSGDGGSGEGHGTVTVEES